MTLARHNSQASNSLSKQQFSCIIGGRNRATLRLSSQWGEIFSEGVFNYDNIIWEPLLMQFLLMRLPFVKFFTTLQVSKNVC